MLFLVYLFIIFCIIIYIDGYNRFINIDVTYSVIKSFGILSEYICICIDIQYKILQHLNQNNGFKCIDLDLDMHIMDCLMRIMCCI